MTNLRMAKVLSNPIIPISLFVGHLYLIALLLRNPLQKVELNWLIKFLRENVPPWKQDCLSKFRLLWRFSLRFHWQYRSKGRKQWQYPCSLLVVSQESCKCTGQGLRYSQNWIFCLFRHSRELQVQSERLSATFKLQSSDRVCQRIFE